MSEQSAELGHTPRCRNSESQDGAPLNHHLQPTVVQSISHWHGVCTIPPNRNPPKEHPPLLLADGQTQCTCSSLGFSGASHSVSQILSSRSYIIPSTRKPPPKPPRSLLLGGKKAFTHCPPAVNSSHQEGRNSRNDAPECCPSMFTTTIRERGAHWRSYGWKNRAFRAPLGPSLIHHYHHRELC